MYVLKHLLKWNYRFLRYPFQTSKIIFEDYRKQKEKNIQLKNNFVWCIGLPKSGTTFIEEILESLNYISLTNSPLRICKDNRSSYSHNVSHKMFENINQKKNTYLKTHTHFFSDFEKYVSFYKPKVIFSFRDLQEMMISRYFHILADKKHRFHYKIVNLNYHEGFKESLVLKSKNDQYFPLKYFYDWIRNWKSYLNKKNNYLQMDYSKLLDSKEKYINEILNYLSIDKKNFKTVLNRLNKNSSQKNKKLDIQLNLVKPRTKNYFKPISKEELLSDNVRNFYNQIMREIK